MRPFVFEHHFLPGLENGTIVRPLSLAPTERSGPACLPNANGSDVTPRRITLASSGSRNAVVPESVTGRVTSKSEVMPGTDSQRRWPEVGLGEITIDLLEATD
jgi:hypothetical protein